MNARTVRRTAIAVVVADVVAVLVTVTLASQNPTNRYAVVDAVCIDGRITQGIDTATPDGLLAYDTGVTC